MRFCNNPYIKSAAGTEIFERPPAAATQTPTKVGCLLGPHCACAARAARAQTLAAAHCDRLQAEWAAGRFISGLRSDSAEATPLWWAAGKWAACASAQPPCSPCCKHRGSHHHLGPHAEPAWPCVDNCASTDVLGMATCPYTPAAHIVDVEACRMHVCGTQHGKGCGQMRLCTTDAKAGGVVPYGVINQ